jgi:hypothetical protein
MPKDHFSLRQLFRISIFLPARPICAALIFVLVSPVEAKSNSVSPPSVTPNRKLQTVSLQNTVGNIAINLDSEDEHALLGDTAFLIRPPRSISFTGKKEFFFRSGEIVNLRAYLHSGGSIWTSRSDIPFKREMYRVLSDYPYTR